MILRRLSQLPEASEDALRAAYVAYTGDAPPAAVARAGRAALEAACANAMLAAIDAAGHLGVPRGTRPQPLTVAELAAARAARGTAPVAAPDNPAPGHRMATGATIEDLSMQPSQLRSTLAPKATGTPNKPRAKPPKKEPGAGRAPRFFAVVPAPGRSKMRAESTRAKVHARIVARHTKTGAPVTVEELDKHFGFATRQYVAKLIFEGHCAAAPEAQ